MNKKILMSLSVIAAAAAAVVGGTGAFFSDTETSTGNTFTAGAIDLKVDSQQHYNNAVCVPNPDEVVGNYYWQLEPNAVATEPQYPVIGSECDGTWDLTDLGPTHQFFDFDDVKPGDFGENTISLHVINNDAWACVDVALTSNDDVTSTEPELDGTGDVADVDGDLFDGELAQNVNFTAWADDGDNIWEFGEPLLFANEQGPASDVLGGKTYALADSTTPFGPMEGSDDPQDARYIGLAWCAGNMTLTEANVIGDPNTIGCDNSMGNITQTDSMTANMTFRVVQARNNDGFTCTPQSQPIEVDQIQG